MHKQELRELLIVLITLLCGNIENHDSINFAENTSNFDHKYHILFSCYSIANAINHSKKGLSAKEFHGLSMDYKIPSIF